MAVSLRWAIANDLDRVAQARWRCYGNAQRDMQKIVDELRADPRAQPTDHLLAERDGEIVGCATSMNFRMWMRGSAISCQGVAWVGSSKTARRRGGSAASPSPATDHGLGSKIMHELLRAARDRGCAVSALMPFRASFYEHFGYGVVERRAEWKIPLSLMPAGDCDGWRFAEEADRPAIVELWNRAVRSGQCDIERPAARWEHRRLAEADGMLLIDRPGKTEPARAVALLVREGNDAHSPLRVVDGQADSPGSFARLLRFLGTLRDQHASAIVPTPADWPIARLLREPQLPHRPVPHPTAQVQTITRMQLRVLDHTALLQSLHLPANRRGKVVVSVQESEGHRSRFQIDLEAGRMTVSPSDAAADFECVDCQWAAIATGELSASTAVRFGLAKAEMPAAELLDVLAAGPVPFCQEYF